MLRYIKKELDNRSTTENGAVGYSTSGSCLLDLNYQVSSLRNASTDTIERLFEKAFYENPAYAVKWLFFARDIRGGLGERRLFRICYRRLADLNIGLFKRNLTNIAEYGRYDDLIHLLGIRPETDEWIIKIIEAQLTLDMERLKSNKKISLLAKWLPSENASSKSTKETARVIRIALGLSSKDYRKVLSLLRKHIGVLERKLCANEWESVDYERVPSMANLKYRDAFMRHDPERRTAYLDSLSKGKSRMNMKVANPVDIVSKYTHGYNTKQYDKTLEMAWKNLKDVNVSDTLVVADGSGSMTVKVNKTTTALDVANALAIYTSEHNTGIYKDKYITFSSEPRFVEFKSDDSLKEKLNTAFDYCEVSNTDIEKVFRLILFVAVQNQIPQEEMIKNVLIISDMEFDKAQTLSWGRGHPNPLTPRLFNHIKELYKEKGYQLPKLIFWNVNSRTKTIPMIENELGVTLVSGFSQNVLKMVCSNKYDPYEVLIEQITNPRYDMVRT